VRVVAVVLAAGASTRPGTPKQDIVFEDETTIARVWRSRRVPVAGFFFR